MRRYARSLILLLGIPACDSPTETEVPERTDQLPALAAAWSCRVAPFIRQAVMSAWVSAGTTRRISSFCLASSPYLGI